MTRTAILALLTCGIQGACTTRIVHRLDLFSLLHHIVEPSEAAAAAAVAVVATSASPATFAEPAAPAATAEGPSPPVLFEQEHAGSSTHKATLSGEEAGPLRDAGGPAHKMPPAVGHASSPAEPEPPIVASRTVYFASRDGHDEQAVFEAGETIGTNGTDTLTNVMRVEGNSGMVAAVMLLLMVMMLSLITYMTSLLGPQVGSHTYKLLFLVNSIIVALLFEKFENYMLMTTIIRLFGGNNHLDEMFNLIPFVFWFVSLRIIGWRLRERGDLQHLVLAIVSHLAAFVAIEIVDEPLGYFEEILEMRGFHHARFMVWAASAWSFMIFFIILRRVSLFVVRKVAGDVSEVRMSDWSAEGEDEEEWMEMVEEAEFEASAIIFGFMAKQLAIIVVDGCHQCEHHSLNEVVNMLAVALGLLIFFVCAALLRERFPHSMRAKHWRILLSHISMALAWVFGTGTKWIFYYAVAHLQSWDNPLHSFTVRKISNAVCLTPLVFSAVVGVNKLAETRVIRNSVAENLITGLGLSLGVAWEKAFANGLRTVLTTFSGVSKSPTLVYCVVTFGLMAMLLPATLWHIVPRARLPTPKFSYEGMEPEASSEEGGGIDEHSYMLTTDREFLPKISEERAFESRVVIERSK